MKPRLLFLFTALYYRLTPTHSKHKISRSTNFHTVQKLDYKTQDREKTIRSDLLRRGWRSTCPAPWGFSDTWPLGLCLSSSVSIEASRPGTTTFIHVVQNLSKLLETARWRLISFLAASLLAAQLNIKKSTSCVQPSWYFTGNSEARKSCTRINAGKPTRWNQHILITVWM